MYHLVVTIHSVYYAIFVIWLSPVYTNKKSIGFHLKGGNALIWQIFSCFNWKIAEFCKISVFLA